MAPVRAVVGVVALVLVFLGGVWLGLGLGAGSETPAPLPAPSHDTELRPSEQPGPDTTVATGNITYRVLGWRCGILAVQGDHADWLADGQYCRVRLRMTSADRHVHEFIADRQTLVTADGERHPVNLNAMQIQDQPTRADARPLAVLEFDIWFDIPSDAGPVALELFGESDDTGERLPLTAQ